MPPTRSFDRSNGVSSFAAEAVADYEVEVLQADAGSGAFTLPTTADKGPAPPMRAAGRFQSTRRAKLLRVGLRALSDVSPDWTARLAYGILARPPRASEPAWQRELRRSARTSTLKFGRRRLALYEWGRPAGPSILMVHGWGARATHLGRMIAPLAEAGFRVISFDAPAHGKSSGRTTDLVEFASALHVVQIAVGSLQAMIGHSFGAAIAMLASRHWGVFAECSVLVSAFDHFGWTCETFGRYAGLTPTVVRRMQQLLDERYHCVIDWSRLSVTDMLRDTHRPALLIHDRSDPEIPFEHSAALARGAPNAQLFATDGLGHHRLLGDQAVIERVVRFVSGGSANLPQHPHRP